MQILRLANEKRTRFFFPEKAQKVMFCHAPGKPNTGIS
jgi:hypothetical protein